MCPFGPEEQELERLHDLLESLWTYESSLIDVVLIDERPEEHQRLRELKAPRSCRIHRLVNPYASRKSRYPRSRGALCVKTLLGLAWIQRNSPARFVLRMDTDALVIAPFAQRLAAFFDAHPQVAQTSCHLVDCNGGPRSWAGWPDRVRSLLRPFRLTDAGGQWKGCWPEQSVWGPLAEVRRHIHKAVSNGYSFGENCMGGAMAVSREWLDRMQSAGYFDDPSIWFHVHIADDVMLGMYARAVGMELANMGQGDVFGVRWKGLGDSPQRLLDRGFAIIHSVASDCQYTESDVRAFFRQQRERELQGAGGSGVRTDRNPRASAVSSD
jgi:hypothetical protein